MGDVVVTLPLQPLPVWSPFEHPEIAMPNNATNTSLDDAGKTADLDASLTSTERTFADTARKVQDGIETLRAQSRVYVDAAGQRFDTAQRYVTERVKERPLTATMAGVGVGMLLGLLLAAGRNSRRTR